METPKKGPTKTTVLVKGDYTGFHVSLGECRGCGSDRFVGQSRVNPNPEAFVSAWSRKGHC